MMIYVTGDTHGMWAERFNEHAFPEQRKLTKHDYVIVLGDFGIWDNSDEQKQELDWLEHRNFTTLFIDGNHENYDILDSFPVEEWHGAKVSYVRPSIIHIKRGQILDLDNTKFFCFGGAASQDVSGGILDPTDPLFEEKKKDLINLCQSFRINHKSWWEREMPSVEEMDEGIENLRKVNNKVDFVISHSPYSSMLQMMGFSVDYLTDYLQIIFRNVDYTQWFFGHIHIDRNYFFDKTTCLYEQIERIR